MIINDDYLIEETIGKDSIHQTIFTTWTNENKENSQARELAYVKFPLKYVYKEYLWKWELRKFGFGMSMINFTPPLTCELFYLHILFNKVKGTTYYKNIQTINDVVHITLKEACYTLGSLDDYGEYVTTIWEASLCGTSRLL